MENDEGDRIIKKLFLFNKKLIHLVDDIFWHMGFHNSMKQEAVVHIESLLFICIIETI